MDRHFIANVIGVIFSAAIVSIGVGIERAKKKREERKRLAARENYIRHYRPIAADERLPTLSKNGFELVDVAELACIIDYDNPLPTLAEKSALSVGNLVKLQFMDNENDVERMWVEIAAKQGDMFKGNLANDPIVVTTIDSSDEIWFHANHIFGIHD